MSAKHTFRLHVDKDGLVHLDIELIRWVLRTRGIISKKRRIIKKTINRFLRKAIIDYLKEHHSADIKK